MALEKAAGNSDKPGGHHHGSVRDGVELAARSQDRACCGDVRCLFAGCDGSKSPAPQLLGLRRGDKSEHMGAAAARRDNLWIGWHYDAKWRSGCLRGDGIRDETAAHSHSLPVSRSRSLRQETASCRAATAIPTESLASVANVWRPGLRAEGVRPGDRVAFLSYNNNQLLEGYYGAPLLRAIAMPLNVRLTAASWCKF